MEMGENINELAKALSAAQSEIKNAKKDTRADKYKYADLAQLIEISREPLTKNGLALIQPVSTNAEGKLTVSTMIMHLSGQWISTTAELPQAVLHGGAGKNPIQVAGCAITYMRRYQLAGMLNIAQEDDDAAGYVAHRPEPKPAPKPAMQAVKPAPMDFEQFNAKKMEWAKWAMDQGMGGFEKLLQGFAARGLLITTEQTSELQELIIGLAANPQMEQTA